MTLRILIVAGIVLIGLTARVWAEVGRATIQGTAEGSTVSGTARLAQSRDEGVVLQVDIKIVDAPPGQHGIHIHQFGDCHDAGNAAGGHYNPHNTSHGFLPKDGVQASHAGDMGNIEIKSDGTGQLQMTLSDVTLAEVAGRAIILHEKLDDFGQPTGNAGGRIGCGPILITKE